MAVRGERVLVLGRSTRGNDALVVGLARQGLDASLVRPAEARSHVRAGDVVIARLDVRRSLDAIEDGMRPLRSLERSGIRVVNPARSLRAAHDKLLSHRLLAEAGLPQPRTWHIRAAEALLELEPPVVLKPRFGSWGEDVFRCNDGEELVARVRDITERPWFARRGVIAQEALPLAESYVRIVVAGCRVVGAVERFAAPGEWRTNLSLGGTIRPVEPTAEARALALKAIAAAQLDLAGVDLYPAAGDWLVLELNGAVEFDGRYSLAGRDVYLDISAALALGRA
jgi:RimK family alpha-L-glutamate ligase